MKTYPEWAEYDHAKSAYQIKAGTYWHRRAKRTYRYGLIHIHANNLADLFEQIQPYNSRRHFWNPLFNRARLVVVVLSTLVCAWITETTDSLFEAWAIAIVAVYAMSKLYKEWGNLE